MRFDASHNIVGNPLTELCIFLSLSFRCDCNVLKSKNIVFPRQKHRFSSSSKYGTVLDSESYLMRDILLENEPKYFSVLKHADTVALTRASKMDFFTEIYIPQFFVQVSSFYITCLSFVLRSLVFTLSTTRKS